jgi:hypothetical protein
MKQNVLDILNAHRVLTLATNRPDGWPQATMVGYADDDLLISMLISRASQKFANLQQDNRAAITIGSDADHLTEIKGLAMSALTYPVREADQQKESYERIVRPARVCVASGAGLDRGGDRPRHTARRGHHRFFKGVGTFGRGPRRRRAARDHGSSAPRGLGSISPSALSPIARAPA